MQEDMNDLHKGHRERMRESHRKFGLPAEAHKQTEMLLFLAQPRVDTNETAHRLVKRFGSLQNILDAETYELEEVEGVGKSTSAVIRFIGDIAREYNAPPPVKSGTRLDTEERIEAHVKSRLSKQRSECVLMTYLDAKGRLLCECLTKDSASSSARVENSLRVILRTALLSGSAGVIVGHNHPKSSPMPSQKDIAEARRLKSALNNIGVGLTDFIIIGEDGETYSLARSGLMI
jgi:DNA repair protein RadC